MSGPPAGVADARRSVLAHGLLRSFNDAGVLTAADVHVALTLTGLAGEHDESVALAAALAVRGPRLGHVRVDLATIADTATVEADEPVDVRALPWPAIEDWLRQLSASPLVALGEEDDTDPERPHPLRLSAGQLYLDRYWREERQVADDLLALSGGAPPAVDELVLAAGLARLFALAAGEHRAEDQPYRAADRQSLAAAAAVLHRLSIVAGGPGTGKTTTVARIAALLAEQAAAAGERPALVALAAPTGRAAARLEQAVREEALLLPVAEEVRSQLRDLRATTLHRLLGWRPDSHSRFRHGRSERLPHDVVIVDETSMVSLWMMARLAEAIRPDARLVLVGDPGQLASVEAGAVLGDLVGPAGDGAVMRPVARAALARATGHELRARDAPAEVTIGDGIVVLARVHRYGEGIAALARAIRRGDADATIEALAQEPPGVTWIPLHAAAVPAGATATVGDTGAHGASPPSHASAPAAAGDPLAPVREGVLGCARTVIDHARAGDAAAAVAALSGFRVLCAHRRGPDGVSVWTARIERWLAARDPAFAANGRWYAGRPLLVTKNDHELRLYNGDTGVIVQRGPERVVAAFERAGELTSFSPLRLGAVETVYAMTIHKSQGSQFATAAVLLPAVESRSLTRELLYTAATRARERLILVGSEETIRAAVERPVARASGLRERVWGPVAWIS